MLSLLLGDNIFFGPNFSAALDQATNMDQGATIFGYFVQDPERFGVMEIDESE